MVGAFPMLLECSYNMATSFPQNERCQRERERKDQVEAILVMSLRHHMAQLLPHSALEVNH